MSRYGPTSLHVTTRQPGACFSLVSTSTTEIDQIGVTADRSRTARRRDSIPHQRRRLRRRRSRAARPPAHGTASGRACSAPAARAVRSGAAVCRAVARPVTPALRDATNERDPPRWWSEAQCRPAGRSVPHNTSHGRRRGRRPKAEGDPSAARAKRLMRCWRAQGRRAGRVASMQPGAALACRDRRCAEMLRCKRRDGRMVDLRANPG